MKLAEIKEQITTTDVYNILQYLGGNPCMRGDVIMSKTISHGGNSMKLFYYGNSKLFVDYTDGANKFDIFDLVATVKNISLGDAVRFITSFLDIDCNNDNGYDDDWSVFKKHRSHEIPKPGFPEVPHQILDNYPEVVISSWVDEGIPYDIQRKFGIKFNPVDSSILIPHMDIEGNVIGIRKRALVDDDVSSGKYRPAVVNGKLWNHPLALNLYGIDMAKDAIRMSGTAIVVEAEKSVMKSHAFGVEQTVACCGSSISMRQAELLAQCDAKELAIAFDADYHEVGDDESLRAIDKLMRQYDKLSSYFKVSFIWDKFGLLGYKDSPFDRGRETFMKLWKERVFI